MVASIQAKSKPPLEISAASVMIIAFTFYEQDTSLVSKNQSEQRLIAAGNVPAFKECDVQHIVR
jgi:hypothetical protein